MVLKGETNTSYLTDNQVTIWNEWATAEQTARFGRAEGELGPIYGHQWRNFGASKKAMAVIMMMVLTRSLG